MHTYNEGNVLEIARKVCKRWKKAKTNRQKPDLLDVIRMVLEEIRLAAPRDDNIVPETIEIPAGTRLFISRYARNLSPTKHVLECDTQVTVIQIRTMKYGGEPCVALCFLYKYQLLWVIVDSFIDNTFI